MSDFLARIRDLSPSRLKLLALELHEQVAKRREPIAVIGIGCRFPGGANSPDEFWQLLSEGRDAIREVPADRWDIDAYFDPDPDAPGRISVRTGGFLDAIDGFDAGFFGIAPREAQTMDPQQRLLLEVTWEALEHAGMSPDRMAGTATGVFVGVCNSDHYQRVIGRGIDTIDAYLASGNANSVAAGRVSYFLGLRGPALSIDTACSSSLVAVHIACQSLRSGESQVAIAAGVNVICTPETTITLSKAHMLAPDGRCKTFDDSADGFARGEGCGVLILKPLSAALAAGDRVLAVLRGTAVNQDGRSGGLTVPNGPAQEAVIRAALADADLSPHDVDYVEAHGTGTSLGDPIEVRALHGALGAGHDRDKPLLIGSVKTNLGHLESAAGVAGLIKVVLSLNHEHIPKQLHFSKPSSHIAWSEMSVEVTGHGRSWPRADRPRRAGVSSFGFSGTNAHVLVEEAPVVPAPASAPDRLVHCWPLSARSREALSTLAADVAVAAASLAPADAAHTLGVGRAHLGERLAVVAATRDEVIEGLTAAVRGGVHPALYTGTVVPGSAPDVVFLFTGQGAQYPGMASALYETSPVFRQAIDECDAVLGGRLKPLLYTDGDGIHDTASTQPALFAVEYALTQVWRSWGVEPAAVIGHSAGEYVAACVAGVFSLEDGLRLIAERGRLMANLPPGGTMAAVFASPDDVAAAIAPWRDRLAIAAVNAADSVVISGEVTAVETVLAQLAARNVQGHRLYISLAAHSPLVEPAMAAMRAMASGVTMQAPRIPVAWNLTGGAPLPGGAPDATYWQRHLREPVRFADGIATLYRDGYRVFLEVGPHPTLGALAQRTLAEDALVLGSLRRGKEDWQELMHSLARLYVRGASIDWAGVDRPYSRRRVSLPTYPFERSRFWIAADTRTRLTRHPSRNRLIGGALPTAIPIFETTLTPTSLSWLADHRILGAVLVAGPVFAEMAQAAAHSLNQPGRAVADLVVHEPLVLPDEGRTVQLHLGEDGAFAVHSRGAADTSWTRHATGRLVAPRMSTVNVLTLSTIEQTLGAPEPGTTYYQRLQELGIQLGPGFRTIISSRRRDGEALSELRLPAECASDGVAWVHPALLDGALQTVGVAVPPTADANDVYLLTEVERIDLAGPLPARVWAHARVHPAASARPAEWRADLSVLDQDGRMLGELSGVVLRRASRASLARVTGQDHCSDLYYQVAWDVAPIVPLVSSALQKPDQFVPAARERLTALAARYGLPIYDQLMPELDQLSSAHIAAAMHALGFDATIGRNFTAECERVGLGVIDRHARLFARLLDILVEDGVLQRGGDEFTVTGALPSPPPEARYDRLLTRFAPVDGELSTLRRCGFSLAAVLRGSEDPLQLLFPGGSLVEARKLYVESPFARTFNTALTDALTSAIAALPADAVLRVLEIGAGTGGTTTYVLPRLPAGRVEYTFTDVSPLFLDRAAELSAAYPFMRRSLLDIERNPLEQGFSAGAYHVVIAANVLHACADLRQAVSHAARLLAPGGLLFILEGVRPERWVDLTFGLTEGWWRFTDTELRTSYPLASRATWLRLLSNLGFTSVAAIPDDGHQALLIARAPAGKRWLVVGDDRDAQLLATRLQDRGDHVERVGVHAPTGGTADGVVYLGDPEPAFTWARRVARGDLDARLFLVADGSLSRAPLWGLGRGFALEHPSRWGGVVETDPRSTDEARLDQLIAALDAEDGEDQVKWSNGERTVARLEAAPAPAPATPRFRPDATYVVTGGYGGLGLVVAQWMAEQGARHLALVGRRPDPTSAGVRAIEALGASVIPIAADVSDETQLTAAFQNLARVAPPVRGIMHAAAHLDAAPLTEMTDVHVAAMFGPKVTGTQLLERLAPNADFLVLFASTTGLLGASGLAHYAAANAFLDAFAHAHNRPGHRVLAIDWGTWEVMRLASAESQRAYREVGLEPISVSAALDALGRLLASDLAEAVVARIDWSVLKPIHEARRARPFLTRLGHTAAVAGALPEAAEAGDLTQRLAGVPAEARHEVILEFVRGEVATVLALERDGTIRVDAGLFELGMDSLMSVELRRRLERGVGRRLPATLTFNYPNIAALTTFLQSELQAAPPAVTQPMVSQVASQSTVFSDSDDSTDSSDLNSLSDDELEIRLRARLEQLR